MIEITAYRSGASLIPSAEIDRQHLLDFPEGRPMKVILAERAPLKVIRWYRTLCHVLAQGMGMVSGDAVHNVFMTRTYRFKTVDYDAEGLVRRIEVESTKDWTLPQWLTYIDHCRLIIATEFLQGVPFGPTRREVERLCGVSLDDAVAEAA